jgi:hypothetical protein
MHKRKHSFVYKTEWACIATILKLDIFGLFLNGYAVAAILFEPFGYSSNFQVAH